jgi:hypothetical protein
MGAELLHAEGQTDRQANKQAGRQAYERTDMTKLVVTFRNFANAP